MGALVSHCSGTMVGEKMTKQKKETSGSIAGDLRKKKGLTQEQVAEKLGISRASYIAIEKGDRELRMTEVRKLADIFGVSIGTFLGEPSQNIEKYKQMFFEFLRVGTDDDRKITKTKLAKLLYLADFAWYYEHLESMSGMRYRKMQYGPVPKDYFSLVDEMDHEGLITINQKDSAFLLSANRASEKEKTDMLTKKQKELIHAISEKWKGRSTKDIVSFTHRQLPYTLCDDNEIIPYELITQEDPEHVY